MPRMDLESGYGKLDLEVFHCPKLSQKVIAWRPLPADAKEDLDPDEVPAWNSDLPREYLVKFADRGFRHVS